ncbi:hypothetical protein GS464_29720 [Rhodococcus hoagii]|nr:hypothetical protein [Prescottella equi]MBM4646577.1 hypothetical protein [Prescottella equi]MBM4646582.1 hypothetical protein [Prescottella equi]MBM4646592.1 hypothetical protein [Prescottella equi]
MVQTKAGAKKAAATIRKAHGKNYWKEIGSLGGKAPYTGKKGFAANPELAREAGARGGRKSKRTASKSEEVRDERV